MKTCSTCQQLKDKTLFGKLKSRKDGLNYVCKSCSTERSRIYRESNPEKRKETCKKYRENNKDACKDSCLRSQEKEKAKGWPAKKAYYLANPNQRKLTQKNWRKKNPEYMKMDKHRRRGAIGKYSEKDIDFLMRSQKGKCVSCFTSLLSGREIDHIIPISRCGTNYPSNIQLLCPSCNRSKGAKDPVEFMQSRGFLL